MKVKVGTETSLQSTWSNCVFSFMISSNSAQCRPVQMRHCKMINYVCTRPCLDSRIRRESVFLSLLGFLLLCPPPSHPQMETANSSFCSTLSCCHCHFALTLYRQGKCSLHPSPANSWMGAALLSEEGLERTEEEMGMRKAHRKVHKQLLPQLFKLPNVAAAGETTTFSLHGALSPNLAQSLAGFLDLY